MNDTSSDFLRLLAALHKLWDEAAARAKFGKHLMVANDDYQQACKELAAEMAWVLKHHALPSLSWLDSTQVPFRVRNCSVTRETIRDHSGQLYCVRHTTHWKRNYLGPGEPPESTSHWFFLDEATARSAAAWIQQTRTEHPFVIMEEVRALRITIGADAWDEWPEESSSLLRMLEATLLSRQKSALTDKVEVQDLEESRSAHPATPADDASLPVVEHRRSAPADSPNPRLNEVAALLPTLDPTSKWAVEQTADALRFLSSGGAGAAGMNVSWNTSIHIRRNDSSRGYTVEEEHTVSSTEGYGQTSSSNHSFQNLDDLTGWLAGRL